MKKVTIFSTLFLAAFVVTAGITVFAGAVNAGVPCPTPICLLTCTTETGPLCTNPALPYYEYGIDCFCPHGNPHHWVPVDPVFQGCCDRPF